MSAKCETVQRAAVFQFGLSVKTWPASTRWPKSSRALLVLAATRDTRARSVIVRTVWPDLTEDQWWTVS